MNGYTVGAGQIAGDMLMHPDKYLRDSIVENMTDEEFDDYIEYVTDPEEYVSKYGKEKVENSQPDMQKIKDIGEDLRQYEEFANVIGKENMPETIDEFLNMKYNKIEENVKRYRELKKLYKYEDQSHLQNRLDYIMPNGEKNFIPDKTIISSIKTIAGTDSKTPLRDVERIATYYGGEYFEWGKRVGKVESSKYMFDVHWYERDGKQYEMKLKHRSDKR